MNAITSMRLEAKRFIPFEFPRGNPQLDDLGFAKDEMSQHVDYPEHCNIPTVIHVNPLTHTLTVQVIEVNDRAELQITLVPIDGDA